ncbi:MAG: hypothetical protein ACYTF6_13875 [Planctomycetota bacterium]
MTIFWGAERVLDEVLPNLPKGHPLRHELVETVADQLRDIADSRGGPTDEGDVARARSLLKRLSP